MTAAGDFFFQPPQSFMASAILARSASAALSARSASPAFHSLCLAASSRAAFLIGASYPGTRGIRVMQVLPTSSFLPSSHLTSYSRRDFSLPHRPHLIFF